MGTLRQLSDRVVESFTNLFRFDADPALDERENVEKVISETGVVAGLIACVQPVPAADVFVLAPLHAKMTLQIGKIKGYEVTQERALDIVKEILGVAWMHLTAQALIGVLGKLIPIARIVLTFPLNYAATYAIGKVADYYFDCMREGTIPSAEVMRSLFAEQFKVGRARGQAFDADEMRARAEALRQRMAARDPGLATRTRLEPRRDGAAAAAAPSAPGDAAAPAGDAAAATGPSGRRAIRIVLDPRPAAARDGSPDDGAEPAADAASAAPVAKTMGPADEPADAPRGIQIAFRPADKTLGEERRAPKTLGPGGDAEPAAPGGAGAAGDAPGPLPASDGAAEDDARTLGELLPGVPLAPTDDASGAGGHTQPAGEREDEPTSLVAQLERLAALHARGVIDAAELARAKAKLLDG